MTGEANPVGQMWSWLGGAVRGMFAGGGLLLWEFLVLRLANVAVGVPEVLPGLVASYALVGAVVGFVAALGGARGPRWATASAWSALGWLTAPMAGVVAGAVGLPGAVGALVAIAVGTGLGLALGTVRAAAWLHLGTATWLWCALSLLAPLVHHLLPGLNAEALGVVTLAMGLALAMAAFTAAFAVEERPPWVPVIAWVALGGLLNGLLELRPEAPARTAEIDADPIVIVALGGLRVDHTGLGSAPADPSATPRLDRFGEQALVFEQAHATSSWSAPSLGSVLTGRLPYRHQAGRHDGSRQLHSPLATAVVPLPEVLRRSGFVTAATVGDPRLRLYGLDRGFEVWQEAPTRGAYPALWPLMEVTGLAPAQWPRIAPAELVTDRALAWIDRQPARGWFLLVQYADAAADVLPADYADVLGQVDGALGRLLDGLPADAWVVVVGDHGRALGEEHPEMLRTASGVPDGHQLYEEILHVPLALRLPTQFPDRVGAPVSIVDVSPTLLAALGESPLRRADGVPLEPVFGLPLADRVVLAQSGRYGTEVQAVIALSHKLMVTRDGRTRLYDRTSDPAEQRPLPVGIERDELLRQLLSAVPPPGGASSDVEDWRSRLGQLGSRLLGRR